MVLCEACGNVLTGRQRKYCSKRCNSRANWNRNRKRYNEEQTNIHRRWAKEFAEWKMERGCAVCGYNKHSVVLDMHHIRDRGRKVRYTDWKFESKEFQKCVVVCANCHREIHAGVIKCPE